MKGAPGFALARSRYMQFMKELMAAKDVRAKALGAADEQLLAKLDARIERNEKRYGNDPNWRMAVPALALRGDLLLRRLSEKLAASAAELRAALDAYLANQERLLAYELDRQDPKSSGGYGFGYGLCHDDDWRFACIPKEELQLASDLRLTANLMDESHIVDAHQILQDLHGLIILGDKPYFSTVKLPKRVCLYKLDPKLPDRALAMLDRGIKLLASYHEDYGAAWLEDETISLHVQRALHHLVVKKPEEAVSDLQAMLNKYPKSKRFSEIEQFLRAILDGQDKAPNGKPFIAPCEDPR
jgi:hypothetical protein